MSYYYLAQPYSGQEEDAIIAAERLVHITLPIWHIPIFSPILHYHSLAEKYKLPTDFDSWARINIAFLRRSFGLVVLPAKGWRESRGVVQEIKWAENYDLPISALNTRLRHVALPDPEDEHTYFLWLNEIFPNFED